jgi:hypothetical protein
MLVQPSLVAGIEGLEPVLHEALRAGRRDKEGRKVSE